MKKINEEPLNKPSSLVSIAMKSTRISALISFYRQLRQFLVHYGIAMRPDNKFNMNYKFALMWSFLPLLAPYWISYSGLISIKYGEGNYSLKNSRNDKWYHKLGKYMFLTFIGPFVLLASQIILAFGDIVSLNLGIAMGNS
jgi:hypothetical protein